MVGLLITGHGHFATGLGSSLRLITGNTENIAVSYTHLDVYKRQGRNNTGMCRS